ncbi:MAG: hypothetical protein WDW38_003096 [Sanguina aurantia]
MDAAACRAGLSGGDGALPDQAEEPPEPSVAGTTSHAVSTTSFHTPPNPPTWYSRLAASRRDILAVSIIYFVEGILDMASLANSYFLKDSLLLTPGMAGLALTVGQIPWEATPLLGLLTDAVPLCGYHRKAYLLFSGVLGSTCWVLLALLATAGSGGDLAGSIGAHSTSVAPCRWDPATHGTGMGTGNASFVHRGHHPVPQQQQRQRGGVPPAAPVEQVESRAAGAAPHPSNHSPIESGRRELTHGHSARHHPAPQQQTTAHTDKHMLGSSGPSQRASRRLLGTLSRLFLPPGQHNLSRSHTGEPPAPGSGSGSLHSTPSPRDSAPSQPAEHAHTGPLDAAGAPAPSQLGPAESAAGVGGSGGAGRVQGPPSWLAWVRAGMVFGVQMRCGLAVLAIFVSSACTAWTQMLLLWCALLGTALNATQLLLVSRLNVVIELSDKLFVLGDYAMLSTLGEVMMTPMLALSARVCPEGAEATLYATFYSILNLSTAISTGLGSALTSLFGVTSADFSHLTWLVLVCNVSMLLPLPLLLTLSGPDPDGGREARPGAATSAELDPSRSGSPRLQHPGVQREQVPLLGPRSVNLMEVWGIGGMSAADALPCGDSLGDGFGSLIEGSFVGQQGSVQGVGVPSSEAAALHSPWAVSGAPAMQRSSQRRTAGRCSSLGGGFVAPVSLTASRHPSPVDDCANTQRASPTEFHPNRPAGYHLDPREAPTLRCKPRRRFSFETLLPGHGTSAQPDRLQGGTLGSGSDHTHRHARSSGARHDGSSDDDSGLGARPSHASSTPHTSPTSHTPRSWEVEESPAAAVAPAAPALQLVVRSSSLAGMASVGGVGGAGVGVSPFARLARLLSSNRSVISLPVAAAIWVAQEEAVAADVHTFGHLDARPGPTSAAMERWCTSQSVVGGGEAAGRGGRNGVGMGRSRSHCGFAMGQARAGVSDEQRIGPSSQPRGRGTLGHSRSSVALR